MKQYISNCKQVCTALLITEKVTKEGIAAFISEHKDDPNNVLMSLSHPKDGTISMGLKDKLTGKYGEFLGVGKPYLVRLDDGSYHAWHRNRFETTFKEKK